MSYKSELFLFLCIYILEFLVRMIWATSWDFSAYKWRSYSTFFLSYLLLILFGLWCLLSTIGWYSPLLCPIGADPSTSTSCGSWFYVEILDSDSYLVCPYLSLFWYLETDMCFEFLGHYIRYFYTMTPNFKDLWDFFQFFAFTYDLGDDFILEVVPRCVLLYILCFLYQFGWLDYSSRLNHDKCHFDPFLGHDKFIRVAKFISLISKE